MHINPGLKIEEDQYATFGKLLIKIQFLETLLKIAISLFKQEVKDHDKAFKNLSPNDILTDLSNNTHKQTLGQLSNFIKGHINAFNEESFKELLEKRNVFIHNLKNHYITSNSATTEELHDFINSLWLLTEEFTKVFIGLISISIRQIDKSGQIDFKGIDKHEIDFIKYSLKNPSH